ncbi:beta-N-acetylhexosaminidase [Puteibacter caeruleilacunae]|nr:beta-N-acetylhexosaminidase [Puteibacter caeruleilacunae]
MEIFKLKLPIPGSFKWACIACFLVLFVTANQLYAQKSDDIFRTRFSVEVLEKAPAKLIPFPQEVKWEYQQKEIRNLWFADFKSTSKLLKDELYQICTTNGIELNHGADYLIEFNTLSSIEEEGYWLNITKDKISVTSSSEKGSYYALKTLRQLLSVKGEHCFLQLCSVKDYPKYPIRGYMIDVGRNFQSVKAIKKQLDIMADYKMNIFHWHLTDRPAWRIESKIYPQLNDPKFHTATRDPGFFYTFDEIREVITYAKKRQITVIPELDMPGHSDYFKRTFGFKMESEKGMLVLEALLNEFFNEIPRNMAPIIHLGSDEVHVHNPKEFVETMVAHVENDDREVITWYPGLNAPKSVIRQIWGSKDPMPAGDLRVIDSDNSYINNAEPMSHIPAVFLKPIGKGQENKFIGGIVCLWPDVNIKRENDVITQNPLYPTILTYAWVTWTADVISSPDKYDLTIPEIGSVGYKYFKAFESILMMHKERYFKHEPFQYYTQTDKHWKIIGPFKNNDGEEVLKQLDKKSYKYDGNKLNWQKVTGNTILLNHEWKKGAHLPKMELGNVYYALTYIYSDEDKDVPVAIAFDSPARNARNYVGVAADGEIDMGGSIVWINDVKVKGPDWENDRVSKFDEGWKQFNAHEIPWRTEELYWTRKPTMIHLNKGKNKVFIKVPKSKYNPLWMYTFTILDDAGLTFKVD